MDPPHAHITFLNDMEGMVCVGHLAASGSEPQAWLLKGEDVKDPERSHRGIPVDVDGYIPNACFIST